MKPRSRSGHSSYPSNLLVWSIANSRQRFGARAEARGEDDKATKQAAAAAAAPVTLISGRIIVTPRRSRRVDSTLYSPDGYRDSAPGYDAAPPASDPGSVLNIRDQMSVSASQTDAGYGAGSSRQDTNDYAVQQPGPLGREIDLFGNEIDENDGGNDDERQELDDDDEGDDQGDSGQDGEEEEDSVYSEDEREYVAADDASELEIMQEEALHEAQQDALRRARELMPAYSADRSAALPSSTTMDRSVGGRQVRDAEDDELMDDLDDLDLAPRTRNRLTTGHFAPEVQFPERSRASRPFVDSSNNQASNSSSPPAAYTIPNRVPTPPARSLLPGTPGFRRRPINMPDRIPEYQFELGFGSIILPHQPSPPPSPSKPKKAKAMKKILAPRKTPVERAPAQKTPAKKAKKNPAAASPSPAARGFVSARSLASAAVRNSSSVGGKNYGRASSSAQEIPNTAAVRTPGRSQRGRNIASARSGLSTAALNLGAVRAGPPPTQYRNFADGPSTQPARNSSPAPRPRLSREQEEARAAQRVRNFSPLPPLPTWEQEEAEDAETRALIRAPRTKKPSREEYDDYGDDTEMN